MTILTAFGSTVAGCIGAADLGGAAYRLDFVGSSRAATAPEITAAQAYEAASTTRTAQAEKTAAAASFDNGALQAADRTQRALVAVVQLVLDEFNLHTQFENDIKAAIAAASSLANLQTRIAAVSSVPTRTQQQLINAVKAKIAATGE